jgi:P-type Mg2+ transporter
MEHLCHLGGHDFDLLRCPLLAGVQEHCRYDQITGVRTHVIVRRTLNGVDPIDMTIDEKTLVPGDVLLVDPGDSVPADCIVLESSNLQVSQSSLTGESDAVQKTGHDQGKKIDGSLFEREHILFAGTSVVSGSGLAIVLMTGDDVFIASITKQLNERRPLNSFQRGIRNVSYMMIGFMVVISRSRG